MKHAIEFLAAAINHHAKGAKVYSSLLERLTSGTLDMTAVWAEKLQAEAEAGPMATDEAMAYHKAFWMLRANI